MRQRKGQHSRLARTHAAYRWYMDHRSKHERYRRFRNDKYRFYRALDSLEMFLYGRDCVRAGCDVRPCRT